MILTELNKKFILTKKLADTFPSKFWQMEFVGQQQKTRVFILIGLWTLKTIREAQISKNKLFGSLEICGTIATKVVEKTFWSFVFDDNNNL